MKNIYIKERIETRKNNNFDILRKRDVIKKDILLTVHRSHRDITISFSGEVIHTEDFQIKNNKWISDYNNCYVSLKNLWDWGLIDMDQLEFELIKKNIDWEN